tara:strand:+ start:4327 stop:4590 length:264 start_codon:yes stop_codon:yes gene_type:complete
MKSDGSRTDPWSIVQTLVLCATAAAIFLAVGRRDHLVDMNSERIGELRDITQDLVKSQVLSEANDANHAHLMQDLKNRVERLENREK